MSQKKATAKGGQKERAGQQQPDLAELLSAVLQHPDTPAQIYNDLQDSLNSSPHYDKAHKTVEFIRALLDGEQEADEETDTARFARHADLIADLRAATDMPEVLRSALDNFCTELALWVAEGDECVCSPETARRHLPAILARAERRGVACPSGGVMFERRRAS
jgi:hypothetical protein